MSSAAAKFGKIDDTCDRDDPKKGKYTALGGSDNEKRGSSTPCSPGKGGRSSS